MNTQDFMRLLEIYGADLDRWPATERAEALRLVEDSEPARLAIAEAHAVDRLLIQAAPVIAAERIDSLADAVVRAPLSPRLQMPAWVERWSYNSRFVYPGMFVLGCAANLVMRLLSARTPLDLLFSSNLIVPLGG